MTRPPLPRQAILLRVALAVGGVLAALLVLQALASRVTPSAVSGNFLVAPPEGLEVPWVLEPGRRVRFDGHSVKIPATTVAINAQGFRADHEIPVSPDPGRRRVLCLGDSFVFGSGVEVDQTFVADWQALLPPSIEVLNLGVPGYTTAHAVNLLEARGLSLRPRAAVIFLTDNDLYDDGGQRPALRSNDTDAVRRFAEARLRGKDKADRKQDTAEELKRLEGRLAAALAHLRRVCELAQIQCRVVPIFDTPFGEALRAAGYDPTPLMDPAYVQDRVSLEIPGDRHPNVEGHRRLAQRLDALLGPWVRAL